MSRLHSRRRNHFSVLHSAFLPLTPSPFHVTFVNLSLLAGTALIVVPIVLHLIMRRKSRHFEFPAMRFIQQRHQVNQRRLRLRHLLLLILRAAAIALLALALARPSIRLQGALSQEAPVAAALVFDTAPRMDYRQDNHTRLEAATEFGAWILAQLPAESRIAVLDSRAGPAVFQVDRGTARERLQRLQTQAASQPLPAVIDEALRLLEGSDLPRRELYVFSDLTQAAWPAEATLRLRNHLAELPEVTVYLVDVGVAKPIDYALGPIQLSGQVLVDRSSLQLHTELSHQGGSGERTVELYLLDRNRSPQKRAVQAVRLEGSESQPVDFRVGGLELGTHQGFVRILGQDGLAADDARFFTIEVKPPWDVLLAAPAPPEHATLFLHQALAPERYRKQGRARFHCQIVSIEDLPRQDLSKWAAVCLLDPTPLAPDLWRKLTDYVSDGHGLGIFLGRNAEPADAFNGTLPQALLPGKLLHPVVRPQEVHLAPSDFAHPVLAPLAWQAGSIPWDLFPVFRYWALSKAEGASVVLPLSDGQPAILERSVGAGRTLTMTTPISDRPSDEPWNLLPIGEAWPFLILTNHMMLYLVGASEEQLNYTAGQTAVLQLDRRNLFPTYTVTAPDSAKFPLAPDQERHLLAFTGTEQPGNYRVQAGGETGGLDRGFSVNLAPEQTNLDRLAPDQIEAQLPSKQFRLVHDQRQMDRAISTARVGREIFPVAILLLAIVLCLEQLLANRFYKE